ncbi:MAG: sporulation transcriptional regulator SpoIIID [Oscillospiraceae bacterium]|nr:sporulation transcriptional regulator SpoIIID [Oscillospiraceae bacterium]
MNDTYIKYINNPNLSRCEAVGRYIAETGDTVRGAAKVFGVSKSTVHKDTKLLKTVDYALYCRVAEVLAVNRQERHIRGGIATRDKYESLRKNKK